MKALVYRKYGQPDVLHFQEIEKPVPASKEILVKVYSTTVNRTDSATVRAIPFFMPLITGLFGPKKRTPGTEFAGIVESVGSDVTRFKTGDRVFGFTDLDFETHAEFAVIRENHASIVPKEMPLEKAAAMSEGFHYGLNFVNKVNIAPGKRVLVNGASGAIGSAIVQILKYYGADVTAVCGTKNLQLVKSIGADRVIDYQQEDFTCCGLKFDCVFDAVGKSSFFKCLSLLYPGGVYISSDLGFMAQNMFLPLLTPLLGLFPGGRKTKFPLPLDIQASLKLAAKLVEEGKYSPLIDEKTYAFDRIVDAYRYVQSGEKTGNVVIKVATEE